MARQSSRPLPLRLQDNSRFRFAKGQSHGPVLTCSQRATRTRLRLTNWKWCTNKALDNAVQVLEDEVSEERAAVHWSGKRVIY